MDCWIFGLMAVGRMARLPPQCMWCHYLRPLGGDGSWRNAVDLRHLPEGTHSLAPRPGSLDRWTFQIGPRGRTCTCNLSGLSGTPLHWATRGWCPRPELHRHCARFKCAVSAFGLRGREELG